MQKVLFVLFATLIISGCGQTTRIRLLDSGDPGRAAQDLLGRHRCPDGAPAFIGGEYLVHHGTMFMLLRYQCPENEYFIVDMSAQYMTHLYSRADRLVSERFTDLYRRGDSIYVENSGGLVWEYSWRVNGGRLLDDLGKDVPFQEMAIARSDH